MKKMGMLLLTWAPAVILGQTLFFKFAASKESVFIFSKIGIEPWGRIASGIVELVAAVLLVVPKTRVYGAVIAFGTMCAAILSHVFVLGIEVQHDGGLLFALAVATAACSLAVIVIDRTKILALFNR